MALQIGPKHIAGIIIQYNLIQYNVLSVLYIFCILYYIQHSEDVALQNFGKDNFWKGIGPISLRFF